MTAPDEAFRFPPSARVPNSALPVLVHRGALPAAAGVAGPARVGLSPTRANSKTEACSQAFEALFARHGWAGAWRNGVYPFHHYHSTSHEVLGVCGGRATLRLGGEAGRDVEVAAGDVVVLPAGTGHRRVAGTADFRVVGAYPDGRDWDLIRADEASDEEVRRAIAAIARVPVPDRDPVTGRAMTELWR